MRTADRLLAGAPPPAGPDGAVDRAALTMLRRIGGDRLARDMAALYLDAVPGWLDAARRALAHGDRAALARAAHTLRGSCGQLGASGAAQLCRELEGRTGAGDPATLGPLLARVECACAAHAAWLARAVAPDDPSS